MELPVGSTFITEAVHNRWRARLLSVMGIRYPAGYVLAIGALQYTAGRTVCPHRIEDLAHPPDLTRRIRNGPPQPAPESHASRTVPAAPRARHHHRVDVHVGRRFRCTMRVERGQLDRYPAVGARACPTASTRRSSRIGAPAAMRLYRLAALTMRAGLAVVDA
jgi:hypothetical protein